MPASLVVVLAHGTEHGDEQRDEQGDEWDRSKEDDAVVNNCSRPDGRCPFAAG